jgi:hypothetical protein
LDATTFGSEGTTGTADIDTEIGSGAPHDHDADATCCGFHTGSVDVAEVDEAAADEEDNAVDVDVDGERVSAAATVAAPGNITGLNAGGDVAGGAALIDGAFVNGAADVGVATAALPVLGPGVVLDVRAGGTGEPTGNGVGDTALLPFTLVERPLSANAFASGG